MRHRGRQVGGPRPECGHGDRQLAGQTTISGGHETRRLFMAAENKLNATVFAKGLHKMQVFVARNAKDIFHALSDERFNELFCSVHYRFSRVVIIPSYLRSALFAGPRSQRFPSPDPSSP